MPLKTNENKTIFLIFLAMWQIKNEAIKTIANQAKKDEGGRASEGHFVLKSW